MRRLRWQRGSQGWLLLAGSLMLGAGVGAASTVWLPGPAAAAVGSTLAAAVFGVVSARAKVLLDSHAEQRAALPEHLVGAGESGRPRRVREFHDPIVLRVHPAETLLRTVDGTLVTDQVPPYVPRDIQAQLWAAVERGGFVLVAGDSTAGKTRVTYEAIRAVLPDHVLVAPTGRGALATVMPVVLEQRRCVVWLDDLERFFGSRGLTATMVTRFLGDGDRHVLVLATLRSVEFDRFSAREESQLSGTDRDSWREAHDVLELATVVELRRRWSTEELQRARRYTDDRRIATALGKTDQFGLAEVLAAGPQLARDWRNAWRPGAHPRGAALVTAAVDCRRAGLHTPQPLDLLVELAEYYLREHGGPLLRPEPLDEALGWAITPSHGTSSLLLPSELDDHYLAFDYLIDLSGLDHVPQATWDTLISHASPEQVYDIGAAALQRFQFGTAVTAYQKAADHNIPDADVEVAFALGFTSDKEQAVRNLTDALIRREREFGPHDLVTLRVRLRLAERHADGHDPVQAVEMLSTLVPDLERILGPDHHDTLTARRWHAYSLGQTGDDTAALRLFESVLHDHVRVLGPDHHDTLLTRHYIAACVAERDPERAVELLVDVRAAYERVLGVDSPRVLQTSHLIALNTGLAGNPAHAADLLRRLRNWNKITN